jgi:hypothetical protein
MNFTQLQERLRLELRRRIERGTLSVSLLARQTGLGQAHLSNFLNSRRGLSLGALDRILGSQRLTAGDLLPNTQGMLLSEQMGERSEVPLVSSAAVLQEPYIRVSTVQRMVALPAGALSELRPKCTASRRQWERFVAMQLTAADAEGMEPVLRGDSLVVIDRHYNSFAAYHAGQANVYAVRNSHGRLVLRYADFQANRLVLRTQNPVMAAEVMEIGHGETPNDYLAGRVALTLHEV